MDGSMTITEIAFEKAPMGAPSVLMHGFKIAFTEAGGEELGRDFANNLAEDSHFQVVYSGSRVTASGDGEGRISFVLDTPYEYTGGNLLVDMSYTGIEGSMYVWSWNPNSYRFMTANGVNSSEGMVSPLVPVVVITGDSVL
ncbi:MAG: hypothetical protein KAR40_00940 [Candidatus Sabulitectum sp.]|nr:hypothetical protein [Candidatus Sabulitectum sp.]